jgi:Spy/CpxP family protein refolding chaperone
MRTLLALVALAVAMLVYTSLPAAADEQPGRRATGRFAERIQDLHLSDQQEAKIADIRKEFRPKVQEAAKELASVVKEEVEKAQGVLTAEQKTKLQTAREEMKQMRAESLAEELAHLGDLQLTDAEITQIANTRKEFRPQIEKALDELEGLLSDAQKKARQEALQGGKKRREVLESLRLSDATKEKLHNVCRKVSTLCREEMEKLRGVLSSEQKEKFQDVREETKENVRDRMAHRIATMKELNLTDVQKSEIAAIRKAYRPRVQEADSKLRASVREEVEAILAVLKGS